MRFLVRQKRTFTWFILVSALAFLAAAVPSAAEGENLISNGSFEQVSSKGLPSGFNTFIPSGPN